jgi:urease accessory protein UreE
VPNTITGITAEANQLYTALAADLVVDLNVPDVTVPADFPVENPTFPALTDLTVADLTTGAVGGTGVFDQLMTAVTAHLDGQHAKNRITGADYANVYLGSIQAMMQYGVQFLLSKDRSKLENLQLQATIRLTNAQLARATADITIARLQIQQLQWQNAEMAFKANTAKNQYALSKLELVTGYYNIDLVEAQTQIAYEQYEAARAQTRNTLSTGEDVAGLLAAEKSVKSAQGKLILEQYEGARAQVRDTLSDGGAIAGITAVEKNIKLAQRELTLEQVDTQRAQTKDTTSAGAAIVGIAAKEKALKDAQGKLILEQYESQRGQTRATLSTGETVVGVLGAQVALYQQQVTSYKRDGETKVAKMILDTWTARKAIDEGVAVPTQIDTAAIDAVVTKLRNNLTL